MYSHFSPRLITDLLFLSHSPNLSKLPRPAFLHPLRFSPHSPQEVASLCPPSLLILPFLLFHIWSGSCGWPGFSGVGKVWREEEKREEEKWKEEGGWVLTRLSIAKPRAQREREKKDLKSKEHCEKKKV